MKETLFLRGCQPARPGPIRRESSALAKRSTTSVRVWVQTPSSATTTVIATFNPNRRRSRTCARARPRVTVTRSFDFGVHHHRHHAQSRVRRSVNLFAAHGNTAGSAWQSYPVWTVVGELFRDRSSLHYKCSYCGWVGCPMMGLSDGDRHDDDDDDLPTRMRALTW